MSRAAILGVGESPIGTVPGRSTVDLQTEAVARAFEDAGIPRPSDGFGIITLESAANPVFMAAAFLAERLGVNPAYLRSLDLGGTAGCIAMLQDAIAAIESGIVRYVAIVFGTTGRSSRGGDRGFPHDKTAPGEAHLELVGAAAPVISYAIVSARLLFEGFATEEALFEIARVHSEHAMRAEQHQRRAPITRERYFGEGFIAWPLRRSDCCMVSDGAGAVILGPATDAMHAPVFVRGITLSSSHASVARAPHLDVILDDFRRTIGRTLSTGGVPLDDVDLLYTHDAFTTSVAFVLTALGTPRGSEMAKWIASGALDLDGELPTNTHGGLLSQAHIGGILHLAEATRQLRGSAGPRQVPRARNALIVGNGGVLATKAAAILTTDAR